MMSVRSYPGVITGSSPSTVALERDISYAVSVNLDGGVLNLTNVQPAAYQWPADQEVIPVAEGTPVTVYDMGGMWRVDLPTPVPATEECP